MRGRAARSALVLGDIVGYAANSRASHRVDRRLRGLTRRRFPLALHPDAAADPPGGEACGLIVRMRSIVAPASQRPLLRRLGAGTVRDLGIGRLILVRPTGTTTAAELEARLERAPGVASVEADRRRTLAGVPNDPWFSQQWALQNAGQELGLFTTGTPGADIRAPQAWDVTMDSPDVLVAVVDSGAALDHPDLLPAIWTNPGETGVDAPRARQACERDRR